MLVATSSHYCSHFYFIFPAVQQGVLLPAERGVQPFPGAGASGDDLVASCLPAFGES